MTVETIVTWNPLPTDTEKTEMQAKAADMAAQGKTDNIVQNDYPNGYPNTPLISIRTWTTQADAQEWLDWLAANITTVPESTQIVS